MADLDPWQRGFLRTLSGSESSYGNRDPYRVMYGGSMFSDFGDHPRQGQLIRTGPNAGRTSSAAGGYQFLGSTWDSVAPRVGVSDFSPSSQDQAALFLAQDVYRRKTGRELQADIQAARRDPQKLGDVLSALHGTWTSLPGGIEPNNATRSAGQRFLNQLNFADTEADGSKPALYGGPTGKMYLDPNSPMRDPNVQPSVNGFTQIAPPVGSGAPQYPAADSPSFLDHPVDWLNTRTGEDTTRADALMQAAAALMAVNNPKGAAVLATQAHTRFPGAEKWSTSFDKNGNIIQSSDRGGVRYRAGAPQPVQYDKVSPEVLKQLSAGYDNALRGNDITHNAFDVVKAMDSGRFKNDFFSTWAARGSQFFGEGTEQGRVAAQLDRLKQNLVLQAQIEQKGPQTEQDAARILGTIENATSRYDPIALRDALKEAITKYGNSTQSFATSIEQARYANPKADPRTFEVYSNFLGKQDKFQKEYTDYQTAYDMKRLGIKEVSSGGGTKAKSVSSASLPPVIPAQVKQKAVAPKRQVSVARNPRTGAPIPPFLPDIITRSYNPRTGRY